MTCRLRDLLGPGSRFMAVAGSLGFEPGPHDAAPGTANAALVNLMRQISRLLGPRGVVVHTIAPGPWTLLASMPSPKRGRRKAVSPSRRSSPVTGTGPA